MWRGKHLPCDFARPKKLKNVMVLCNCKVVKFIVNTFYGGMDLAAPSVTVAQTDSKNVNKLNQVAAGLVSIVTTLRERV